MNKNGHSLKFFRGTSKPSNSTRAGWLAILLLVISAIGVQAQSNLQRPEDKYLDIFFLIQQANRLEQNGQADAAHDKYLKAQTELRQLEQNYPNWNAPMIKYRLDYLGDKINPPQPEAGTNAEESTETQTPEPTANHAAAAKTAAVIKLLDPGAEPRQTLRLHPKAGETQNVNLNLNMSMEMQMGDAPAQPASIPTMTIPLSVTVKSVSQDGSSSYTMMIGEPSVGEDTNSNPMIGAAVKSSLAMFKGLTITGTMSDRGVSSSTQLKLPPNAPAQMRQTMSQMRESLANVTMPLPEEAVGKGAKWEARMPVKSQGMTIEQTATYELVAVNGDRVEVKTSLSQSAANQTVQNPAMPNVKVDLDKLSADGSGTLTQNLSNLMPDDASVNSHTETDMAVNMGGRKQPMNMKMDMKVHLQSR